jgi:hypothetical protein
VPWTAEQKKRLEEIQEDGRAILESGAGWDKTLEQLRELKERMVELWTRCRQAERGKSR